MRTSAKVGPRCGERIANKIASDAAGDSQLAVLDCAYDVVKRKCPDEIHAVLLEIDEQMLTRERLARAQREEEIRGARDPYRNSKCDCEVGVGLRRRRGEDLCGACVTRIGADFQKNLQQKSEDFDFGKALELAD
jgi:hypothetical protein